jgi:hypothetical protein
LDNLALFLKLHVLNRSHSRWLNQLIHLIIKKFNLLIDWWIDLEDGINSGIWNIMWWDDRFLLYGRQCENYEDKSKAQVGLLQSRFYLSRFIRILHYLYDFEQCFKKKKILTEGLKSYAILKLCNWFIFLCVLAYNTDTKR